MPGPHTLIKRPHIKGPPQDVVVDEDYEEGKSFKVED